ncbi:MAG: glutathione S-transferase family protein [Sulfitobacter sp.]
MNLFYAQGTVAIAPAIALIEAGIPHELTCIDFATGEQTKPEFLAVNPKGRVPALILADGTILTETGALLDYIAALAPSAGLTPDAPVDAAHMRSTMYYLASTMHVAHAHKMRGTRWATNPDSFADMAAKVPETMAVCAKFIETDCLRGDYVCGDQFTLADAYLYFGCSLLDPDGVDLNDFPLVRGFMERMENRDSVKEIRAKGMV